MKKISTITFLIWFALCMPMMAVEQIPSRDPHYKKEMREKHHPRAMRDQDFKMMCEVVEDASYYKQQIGVIKVACISSYFSSEQCVKLLSIFSFENAKLEALEVLVPRVLEPDAKEILKQFSFFSNKEKALEILFP